MKLLIFLNGFCTSIKLFFLDWSNRCNKSLSFLFVIWLCLYLAAFFVKYYDVNVGSYGKFTIAVLAIFVPFLFLVIISTNNKVYDFLSRKVWFKIILSIVFLTYGLVANTWASGYINQLYRVSASNFPVTQIVLTMVFFVVYIMKGIFGYLYVSIVLGSAFFGILISMPNKKIGAVTWMFIKLLIASFVVSTTFYSIGNMERFLSAYTQSVAYNSDFYSYAYCVNDQRENNKYIFLGAGKMLIAKKGFNTNALFVYTIERCDSD